MLVVRLGRELLAIEREFGLTPAARTRIQLIAENRSGKDANAYKRDFFAAGANAGPPPPGLLVGDPKAG